MQVVKLAQVVVGPRQRKKIDPGPIVELSEDIAKLGLLHAPVVIPRVDLDGKIIDDQRMPVFELVAGERRFRAIKRLAEQKRSFTHNNGKIEPGFIPVTLFDEALGTNERFEAELSENIHRVEIAWQDRVEALSQLHEMRRCTDHTTTVTSTAAAIVEKQGGLTPAIVPSDQPAVKAMAEKIKQASVVARHLHNPKIAGARNATEAYNQVLKMQEDDFRAALARKNLASMPVKPLIELHHGDLTVVLPSLAPGLVDLIIADPPYGIGASGGGFRSRTVHHHNYDDTPANARELARCILLEGFRICKPRANLFMFTDIQHWEWLQETAAQLGWTPFRRPGIWIKSQVEGLAPWGSQGFRIGTEFFFFATKGQRGLISSPMDTFSFGRVHRDDREHGAEKPIDLLSRLIECSTIPGDVVLDPCCGSGSTLVAASRLKRAAIGIECDADYHKIAFKNAFGAPDATADSASPAEVL